MLLYLRWLDISSLVVEALIGTSHGFKHAAHFIENPYSFVCITISKAY